MDLDFQTSREPVLECLTRSSFRPRGLDDPRGPLIDPPLLIRRTRTRIGVKMINILKITPFLWTIVRVKTYLWLAMLLFNLQVIPFVCFV